MYQCKGCRVLSASPFPTSHAYERINGEIVKCTEPGMDYIPSESERIIIENTEVLKKVLEKLK